MTQQGLEEARRFTPGKSALAGGLIVILGLSFSHNATVCVVDARQGEILFCCSEERFSRRKNDWGIPYRALAHVFERVAGPREIRIVTVGESCHLRYGCKEYAALMNLVDYATKDAYTRSKARLLYVVLKEGLARSLHVSPELQELVTGRFRDLNLRGQTTFIDHHHAHAASAYYGSPFDEALVVTLDGEGDGLSGSCWSGRGSLLTRVDVLPEDASVGLFYKSITSFLGFKVNQQEGKVTGLAGYGDPSRFYTRLRRFLHANTQGNRLRIVSEAASHHMAKLSRRKVHFLRLLSYMPMVWRSREWKALLNGILQREFREMYRELFGNTGEEIPFSLAADIAAAAQQVFEDAVLEIIGFFQRRAPSRNIALAGGVFANVQLNKRILELSGVEHIYLHPGMGDEGLAFGAAMLHIHMNRREKVSPMCSHVFYGPRYDNAAIRKALNQASLRGRAATDGEIVEWLAQALFAGRVVGLFRGASEYGPRALGNRSILANPMSRDTRIRLSARLRRSEFMPFAPAVLDGCFDTLFVGPKLTGARHAARFMTIALAVDARWRERVPAAVHVDGTARPQIVCEEHNPFFYRVIKRFHELTGVGCVLNTSMNLHEEPLANTPDDALQVLKQGAVDAMVLGNVVVNNEENAPLAAQPESRRPGHGGVTCPD